MAENLHEVARLKLERLTGTQGGDALQRPREPWEGLAGR